METNTDKTEKKNIDGKKPEGSGKLWRCAASAIFALLICALSVTAYFTGNLGANRRGEIRESTVTEKPETPQPTPSKAVETTAPSDPPQDTAPLPADETPEPEEYVKTTVFVDGEAKATLASRQAAEEMIKNAVSRFENLCMAKGLVSTVKNTIEIKDAEATAQVMSYDEAYRLFTGGQSPITVESRAGAVEFESIPHEKETVKSDKLYIGTRLVSVYGHDGKTMTAFEYTYINGMLTETAELEKKTLYPPVNEVVIMGTAKIPDSKKPKGSFGREDCPKTELKFKFPVQAEIVKFFGFYEGVMNNGIDFSAEEGKDCSASCAGTVLAVIERGNRGMTVDIMHEGGFITRCIGLDKVIVNVGDTVMSGEVLGYVGSKGLHFEILYEARPRNPRIYLLNLFD